MLVNGQLKTTTVIENTERQLEKVSLIISVGVIRFQWE
jgi:hypothetical protein